MTSKKNPTAEELAGDPISFLSPRFGEILNPEAWGDGGRTPTRRDAGSGTFYRPDILLTMDRFADHAARFLDRKKIENRRLSRVFDDTGRRLTARKRGRQEGGRRFSTLQQVTAFEIPGDPTRERDSLELARLLKREAENPDSAVPEDLVVGPLHVLTLAQGPSIGPGCDPLPGSADDAAPGGRSSRGTPAPVGVVDTGLWKEALDGWSFVEGDLEDPVPIAGSVVPWRGSGHGGFIAWLVNCVAPGTKVQVKNAFTAFDPGDSYGGLTELVVVDRVNDLIDQGFRIINLSLGTKIDACLGADPVILRAAMEDWSRIAKVLIVAAAGNDASTDPWYPAGYAADPRFAHAVVSVGALEGKGHQRTTPPHSRVAAFSNHGPWVTAWAPGVDLVSAYPPGVIFEYTDDLSNVLDSRSFDDGLASWSGTSFATPVVAAQIAAATGSSGDPRKVWKDWRQGRPFAVLWPEWWGEDGKPCIPT